MRQINLNVMNASQSQFGFQGAPNSGSKNAYSNANAYQQNNNNQYGNNPAPANTLKCWHCDANSFEECATKGMEKTCQGHQVK